MPKYFDIHTHKIYSDQDVLFIRSYLIGTEAINAEYYFSVGCHPWYADNFSEDVFTLLQNACDNDNCLAIGEIGLDKLKGAPLEIQEEVFIKQVRFAQSLNKPVIIHSVRAYNEILRLRKVYFSLPWIIHGFYGSKESAKQLINKGIYLSIGSKLLREKSRLREVLHYVPMNYIFFETDIWENSVKDIYFAAAEILSIDIEVLQQRIKDNFNKVFNINVV